MSNADVQKVQNFLNDIQAISTDQWEQIAAIRAVFNKIGPELRGGIMYGGLVFFVGKELVSGIFPYKNHISIEFGNGVNFSDPDGLLEGKGKMRRHLKIFARSDIVDKKIEYYIKQAVGE